MAVNVCLPLFGNPGRELEEGAALKGQQLRTLATELSDRLQKAAEILDRLAAAGWNARVAMYDALLLHAEVETQEEAVRRLQELGIDPTELMIVEEVEDEEMPEDGGGPACR